MTLVHRSRNVDAFATGWAQTGQDRLAVQARLPHDHAFFAPVQGRLHDPVLVAETIRQSALVALHGLYGVPLDYQLLLAALDFKCVAPLIDNSAPVTDVLVEVTGSEIKMRGPHPGSLRLDMVIRQGNTVVAHGALAARITSPRAYTRLRDGRTEPRTSMPASTLAHPSTVGRSTPADVLLEPTAHAHTWHLSVDTNHSTLFQSPKDHVPGMLLLEAARQASVELTHADSAPFYPGSAETAFYGYVELDEPCRIRAVRVPSLVPDTTAVQVTGTQKDAPVFVTTFTG
ncbi:ScbA/BarX family gamma-butyrolactone biosynthesis protein [Streptomyces sp. NBC_00009]|uniref:ScbA/BarX family gamma-butyrolactone biosynthesis protein n=1 Tax=Streptomyces sp. NBC_00009 TaxID=2975620 RepID=UPI003249C40B